MNQIIRDNHVLCGGIFVTNKQNMDMVGGYPEEILCWGIEDEILSLKFCKVLGNIKYLNNKVYHLYHGQASCPPDFLALKNKILNLFHYLPAELYREKNCDFFSLLDNSRNLYNQYINYCSKLGVTFSKNEK